MADKVAVIAAITNFPTNTIKTVVVLNNLGLSSNHTKVTYLKKTSLHIIINLVEYEVFLNERLLKNI